MYRNSVDAKIYHIGKLVFQSNWDWSGWYYINQKNERVNMHFYIGSVIPPENDSTLYQFILGPYMLSWGWKK